MIVDDLDLGGAWAEEPPTMKVGFAERDITPEIGMEQPGGYVKAFHRSLHDPCKVRVAVFDDGSRRVAVVSLDALIIREPQVRAIREGIASRTGIPPEAVLIAASHSHSSGPTGMVLPGEYDHAPEFVQKLAYEMSSCADPRYLERVVAAAIEAVSAADQARVPAFCGAGKGIEKDVSFNRRFRMKNGLTFTHPGQGNPDIVEPAGPIDPEVGVIGAWDTEGRFLGCIVNFACHATTSPGGISANWIYYMERVIRGALEAPEAVVVFLPGACGDVTQVDNLSPYRHPSGERWARIVGGSVGAEAVKVLFKMERGSLVPVDYRVKRWTVSRRIPDPQRVEKCREIAARDPKEVGHTDWVFAKEIVLLDALLQKHPTAEVEVQAIQIGPVVLLANPAELFCQLGLDMKAGSPFPLTFPVELANGCVGYVPTEEALGPHGGGYETRLTSYSNLEPTAGTQIVQAAVELARSLTPGKIPTRPPAPPFQGSGWSYGNVPPELK
jgi:hypothetical protein